MYMYYKLAVENWPLVDGSALKCCYKCIISAVSF